MRVSFEDSGSRLHSVSTRQASLPQVYRRVRNDILRQAQDDRASWNDSLSLHFSEVNDPVEQKDKVLFHKKSLPLAEVFSIGIDSTSLSFGHYI